MVCVAQQFPTLILTGTRRRPTIAAFLCALLASPALAAPADWRTPAERSGYRTTPNYDATMAYCRRLADASPWVKLTTYGTSGQGRALPLVIVSKDSAFTPEAARATGKPILLIQNGIHAGEIEGKDASLELVRDIAITQKRSGLADGVILLILPIFSVDAHERSSRYNRINQNGPDEMGWRSTPIGLNLNRDYVKVETPEMRALIGNVFTQWWPHLLVDNHTTDGADYQHDLTYGIPHGPTCPPPVERWLAEAFEDRVVRRVNAMGHLTAPYLSFVRGADPTSGIDFSVGPPRFSTTYAAVQCRPAVLVETHMLKPYRTRVRATYDLMVALLEEVNAHPQALLAAVHQAEEDNRQVGRGMAMRAAVIPASTSNTPRDPRPLVALRSRLVQTSPRTFVFRGKKTRWETSEIAGAPVPRYSTAAWDTVIPWLRDEEPTVTTRRPLGYIVPREWKTVRELLEIHGVRTRRFADAWTDTVELQRIVTWHAETALREGHYPTIVDSVTYELRQRTFRAGDLWVPLDQPRALIAMHLLEARAPDGMMFWNAFDTVLMQKEYAEDYVMDPIARRMMRAQPALGDSFRARVARDSSFARDPAARVNWFYSRSSWADPEFNLHPAARALRMPSAVALEPAADARR